MCDERNEPLALEATPGREAHRGAGRADRVRDRVHDPERETTTVLDGSAVLIRAIVGRVLLELVGEVPARGCRLAP
jgi:hypothetical protein